MRKAVPVLKLIVKHIGNLFSWVLIKLVRFYQLAISPFLGSNCRHYPTCSNYMIEAVKEWGFLKGVWLGLKRIVKCHPWGTSGADPVPKKEQNTPDK
ncbi:MAG: membrane protein insertion efficiency factor YidD [Balneolaceae bacterium]|nr:membrane protein insertion efficiency factor YidD [Balneolaceae bacterium]